MYLSRFPTYKQRKYKIGKIMKLTKIKVFDEICLKSIRPIGVTRPQKGGQINFKNGHTTTLPDTDRQCIPKFDSTYKKAVSEAVTIRYHRAAVCGCVHTLYNRGTASGVPNVNSPRDSNIIG